MTRAPAGHGKAAHTPVERYRRAEGTLWKHYGLEPTEHFVDLRSPRVRIRAQVVGSGTPILFIHGGVWPGAVFASLVSELDGFRCVILDRPGCGLSSALDYSKHAYKDLVTQLLTGVLDALGIERTHVVGQEVGAAWAVMLAAAHASRVEGLVLMGAAPLVREQPVPTFLKVLASPIGALIVRLPQSRGQARSILRQDGHGRSVEAGQIPDAYLNWHVALMRETATMRNERALIRATLRRGGWRPEVTFAASELARVRQPTLYVYGTNDPESTVERVRHVVGLLPAAELHLIDSGGHLPWLDDPGPVGARVRGFLAGK